MLCLYVFTYFLLSALVEIYIQIKVQRCFIPNESGDGTDRTTVTQNQRQTLQLIDSIDLGIIQLKTAKIKREKKIRLCTVCSHCVEIFFYSATVQ